TVALHSHARSGRRITTAAALLEGFNAKAVLAGKAYDANWLRAIISQMGAEAVIPCNPTRSCPPATLPRTDYATALSAASTSSSTSGASQPDTTASQDTSSHSSISPLL
ncbi:hypothetical protein NM680_15140, partial [Paracoccus sp. PS-1]|nr:hypothetical protein [Paracoccus sp. PS1]